jgi:hypothetical protein
MIAIFTGLPGSGKSTKLASTLVDVLYRNKFYYEKRMTAWTKYIEECNKRGIPEDQRQPAPQKRLLWTNLKLKPPVEAEFEGYFEYWKDLRQLTVLKDVDVAIDEVATYFDARLWDTLSLEMRRWLAQHRKFVIEIYGTAQDFAQCDKSFRRLTSNLLYLKKIIGSGDISPTRPPPKFIWGIVFVRELDPTTYDEQKSKFADGHSMPSIMLINRSMTEIFDTRAEVLLSSALPLKHLEKECELPNCTFHKTVHV